MKRKILLFIIFIASVVRIWNINNYPALNADEAALGYNAYSLLETGKDEHGNSWPIHFQSFNDYKPGLYVYILLPFVKLFGLTEFTVRLPGVVFGIGSVFLIYFLAKEISKKNELFSLLASLFLAISPWHIHYSRGAWEVNVATFFIIAGVLFFFKALKNPKLLLISIILFILSTYTYHAARIISPILILLLSIIFVDKLMNNKKWIIISIFTGAILILPLGIDLLGPGGLSRASGVGIFADRGPVNRLNEERGEHEDLSSMQAKIYHNKLVNYSLVFVDNWAKHFHGEFLFLSGDEIQRNRVPETGQMYIYDAGLLILGVYFISFKPTKKWLAVFIWLVIAPFAAALTFQSPHALRSMNMVIPLLLISAYGANSLYQLLPHKIRKVSVLFFGIIITISFARYVHLYSLHLAKEYPYSSQYGLKELVDYLNKFDSKYSKVFVTDRYDQPYILYLFYSKVKPVEFQSNHYLSEKDSFGFSTVRQYNKYNFVPIQFENIKSENPNSLIVGTSEEIPKEANIVKKIYGPNGKEVFVIVAN